MPRQEEVHDPYAPPPRYKNRSGGMVRVAILAGLLGAAGWGYMEYSKHPQQALVEPEAQEQVLAENNAGTAYDVTTPAPAETAQPTPSTETPDTAQPQSTTPAEVPEMSAQPPL